MAHVNENRPDDTLENAPEISTESNVVIPPAKERPMTYSEYKASRGSFTFACIISIGVFLLLSALPAIFIWAAIDTNDPSNRMNGSAMLIMIGIPGFVILLIFFGLCKVIGESYNSLKEDKKRFRRTAEEKELKMAKRKK